MEEKRGEKTYLLEAMRSNRRRIGLMVVPFFVVVAVFVALFALLLAPKEGRWWAKLPLVAGISAAITAAAFPFTYRLGLDNCGRMLEQSFPPASLDDGDDAKLKNAAEGILLALGLQGVEVKAVAMRGVNAISSQARGGGAVILVSREAVESLSKGELEALLAHEAYHISTQETRLWALGAGLSGVIMLAQSAERRRWYAKDLEEDAVFRALKEGSGYAGIMAMVLGYFMFVVFMPVWISYFIFFLPRDRDFLADEHAMLITKSPEDVISAIEKSQRSKTLAAKWGGLLFNHMFFNQPLCVHRGLAGFLARRLNIHPPSQERVARIRSMC